MQYTITSDTLAVADKKKGDQIAEKDLLEHGCNIAALVGAGHLSINRPTTLQTEGADD